MMNHFAKAIFGFAFIASVLGTSICAYGEEADDTPVQAPPEEPQAKVPVAIKKAGDAGKPDARAKTAPWIVEWTSSDGQTGKANGNLTQAQEETRPLVFLAVTSPLPAATKFEHKVGEEWAPLLSQNKDGKLLLLLSSSVEKVRLDGSSIYTFKVLPHTPTLSLATNCRKYGMSISALEGQPSPFPAVLSCKFNSKTGNQFLFSTFADAEWYGAGIYETGGKGERWKAFAFKDVVTLEKWRISWGNDDNKIVSQVNIAKSLLPTKIPPKPSFFFAVGAGFLTGTVSSSGQSASLSGLEVPVGVRYQKDGSFWFLGSSYQFFAYSLSSSNSTSVLEIFGGADFNFNKFRVSPRIGYFNRYLNTGSLQIGSTFEAPKLGADLTYRLGSKTLGLSLYDARTSSQGQFSELEFGAFYQSNLLFKKLTKIFLQDTQLTASSSGVSLTGSWFTIGLSVQF